MSDDIDKIRKELEEVRRLKEELRREVDAVRREKEDTHRLRAEARRRESHRTPRTPRVPRVKPVKPVKPPRLARVAEVDLNLDGLTDSLETMMDGLGHSIEMSLKSIEGMKIPGIRFRKGRRRTKKRDKQLQMLESIAPERVAKIVAPLGNEERLRILEYLKTGGKSFNDIENETGKTGSSLTHHLNPLIEAGYVVKGEVRGTYYVTVEGRLAYRLAQWLTYRVERQRKQTGNNGSVDVEFEDDEEQIIVLEDEKLHEAAEEHLEELAEELEEKREELEEHREELVEELQDRIDDLEELEDEFEDEVEDTEDEPDDLDSLDWDD